MINIGDKAFIPAGATIFSSDPRNREFTAQRYRSVEVEAKFGTDPDLFIAWRERDFPDDPLFWYWTEARNARRWFE